MTINGTEIYMTRGDNESITITVDGQELLGDDIAELTVRQTVRSEKVIHKTAVLSYEAIRNPSGPSASRK